MGLLSHTRVADKEPQAAYSALTKSFKMNAWTFLQRIVCGCDSSFVDLDKLTKFSQFLPVLFGCEISSMEYKLLSLSTS